MTNFDDHAERLQDQPKNSATPTGRRRRVIKRRKRSRKPLATNQVKARFLADRSGSVTARSSRTIPTDPHSPGTSFFAGAPWLFRVGYQTCDDPTIRYRRLTETEIQLINIVNELGEDEAFARLIRPL